MPKANDRPSREPEGFLAGLWNSLSSIKLAVTLLLAVAAASLLGFVGLPGVYHSPWYVALLLFLSLNAFACGCKAWRRAVRRLRMPSASTTADQVGAMRFTQRANSPLPPTAALENAFTSLRGLGYQVVHNETEDGAQCILGRKRAWAAWGSPLLHFSLLLVVTGGLVGSWPGLSFDQMLLLGEGETSDVGNFDFRLRLDDFRMEYYPDGSISEYESDLSVLGDGQVLKQKTIRVNDPLQFEGVRFFQSDWRLVGLRVRVTGPDAAAEMVSFPLQGSPETGWEIPLQDEAGEWAAVQKMPSTGWGLFAHDFWQDYAVVDANGRVLSNRRQPQGPKEFPANVGAYPRNPAVQLFVYRDFEKNKQDYHKLGTLTAGHNLKYQGYRFQLAGLEEYSGLEARKDPGRPILYAGFVLIVAASFLTLYLAPRTVRMYLAAGKQGTEAIMGAATRLGAGFEREFAALAAAMQGTTD